MSTLQSLYGQQFGELTAIDYAGNRKWNCECKEGHITQVGTYHLTSGRITKCSICTKLNAAVKIGDTFGEMTVVEKLDGKYWRCECAEGHSERLSSKSLTTMTDRKCRECTRIRGGNGIIQIGDKINEWTAIEYLGHGKWLFECSCKKRKVLEAASVRKGESKSCGHGYNEFKDLTGATVGDFEVISYLGDHSWQCKCLKCGSIKAIDKRSILNQSNIVCKNCAYLEEQSKFIKMRKPRYEDLTEQRFGDFVAKRYLGKSYWECECTTCGKTKVASKYQLVNRNHTCNHFKVGNTYGEWTVLEILDNSKAKCVCSCTREKEVYIGDLIDGKSKSCGHSKNQFIDISGQQIGNWKVLEYKGDSMWTCECQCENKTIRDIHTYSLRTGNSRSCGCLKGTLSMESKLKNCGELNTAKIDNPREPWQIMTLNDKDKLSEFLDKFSDITVTELSILLSVNYSTMLQKLKKFNLTDKVNINYNISLKERELAEFVKSIYNGEILTNKMNIIPNRELDIYIPELKIAIEFNGTYWHSDSVKYIKYHQDKTLACRKLGIRLIHIFEYEWDDPIKNNLIKKLLIDALDTNKTKIYARKTKIREIDTNTCKQFLEQYHLQGTLYSKVRLGCYYNDELIGVMTLGTPRFNREYQYELHRLCWKNNYIVIGGFEKLFRYFINNYKPESIISYSDLTKFKASSYTRIGFIEDEITHPNYLWIEPNTKEIINRYSAQKHKLIAKGLGTADQTEDEIMKSLNYLKIYDSGNARFIWERK